MEFLTAPLVLCGAVGPPQTAPVQSWALAGVQWEAGGTAGDGRGTAAPGSWQGARRCLLPALPWLEPGTACAAGQGREPEQ